VLHVADAHLSGYGERSEPILEPCADRPRDATSLAQQQKLTSEPGHSTKKNGSALALPFSASAMDSTYAPALAAFTMNSERMFSAIPLK
jgi:hypothetical protein